MAHTKSALKRNRTSKLANIRNKSKKSAFATFEKKFRSAVADGDVNVAGEALNTCLSRLDKNAKDGVFHKNKADRKKAQLQKLFGAMGK
ncbi:MAG: 30S ribosomal protein S20 [Victivallales bacterium]|nr:30S ribosomal protein S20 [Victivallales bacterium]